MVDGQFREKLEEAEKAAADKWTAGTQEIAWTFSPAKHSPASCPVPVAASSFQTQMQIVSSLTCYFLSTTETQWESVSAWCSGRDCEPS